MAYKVLCFSGGGIRGIFQATLLNTLQKDLGPFWKDFDLIAGTSTGAIIALGLTLNKSPAEIVEFFVSHGPKIFGKWKNPVKGSPYYNQKPLKNALEEAFGSETLGKCNPEVAIVSTDLSDYSVRVFSPLTKGTDKNFLAVNVAMASAAAPAYFPSYPLSKRTYIDGGLWANDPSVAALTLANESRMIDFKHMRLMHIGNGEKLTGGTKSKHDKIAPVRMPYYLIDMFFSAQADAAREFAARILGPGNVLDVNIELTSNIALDDHKKALKDLPSLASKTAKKRYKDIERFLANNK